MGSPAMRQEFVDPVGRLRRQPLQYIARVGIRIKSVERGRLNEAHHRRSPFARAQAAGEEPVLPPQRNGPDAVLHPLVVDGQVFVIEVAGQCRPALGAVVDGPGGG